MKVTEIESRERELCLRVGRNPEFWTPLHTLAEKLNEQGVLELFIRSDKVEELNALLGVKVTKFKPSITKSTYTKGCSTIFMQNVISKIYDKKQDDVTDQEIKDEVENFVNNPSYAKIFQGLLWQSHVLTTFGYKKYVETYKKVPGTTEEDIKYIDKIFRAAFPKGVQYEMPSKQWVKNNQVLRDEIHMSGYFAASYVDDVFGNIQHMSQKAMSAEAKETADFRTIACVEMQLLAQFIAERNKMMKEVDAKEVNEYVERLKEEKPLYLMAMYYVYAYNSFQIVTANK